ncbi:protein CUP-SHAPED COTYLEDON 3 [Populus alba]|nr:protein CUP-SHAPED COTYLEDON 3-like [Populus alba]KAJ6998137.1 protein CUP-SHAPEDTYLEDON 3-like [Populus alba x Populus x berolinensis]KAJ6998143.1 protein CUP-SHAPEDTYLEDON 3-like [Populus alba x Populus x berolinensis]
MGLRDIGATLPPGFRFYPSDEELVCHYLYKKITNEEVLKGTLVEVDLHTCEPWQLPEVAKLNATEWYFFSFRDRKYATGFRTNRATTTGYWKATGKDRTVLDPTTREVVGMRKTLVFYRNRAPNGIKTGWIMHEFRLETPHMHPKEDWVLCRVFHKSKAEDYNAKFSPQLMFETTTSSGTVNLAASPLSTDHQTLPCGYHQQMTSLSSNPPHQNQDQSSLLNLLQLSQDRNANPNISTDISSRAVDEYAFLWDDMNMEETSLGDGVLASNLEDMRFEIDHNSMVFI